MKLEADETRDTAWCKYAKTYDPIKCASIDGTDCEPHDRAVIRALDSDYKPNRFVKGRPESTIFISRLNHETSKETIKDIFSKYGKLRRFRMVKDIVTGMPKGYAFVEYEEEQAAEEAYRLANKMVVDGNAIFVDFECERLLKGWKPRRLGGGFAGKKESGQLRFGGRDRPFKKPIALELREQEGRRQKERRSRDDERRRRDHSRDRNRRKSPLHENGIGKEQKAPKIPDLSSKDKTPCTDSSKNQKDEGSPPRKKSSSVKNSNSTPPHQESDTVKKAEPSINSASRSPSLNKPASDKMSSRKHLDEADAPSKEFTKHPKENRERRENRRNRSNERRRSPITDSGRHRSPTDRNRKRSPPRRPKRNSRSPKRPAGRRSPWKTTDKEPATTRDRLRSRSPLRKHDEGLSPTRCDRRTRRAKQESSERQGNNCSERLPSEHNRIAQLSPRRTNERPSRTVRSPRRLQQGFEERAPMLRDKSPSRRPARDEYPAERVTDRNQRRLPVNDSKGGFPENRPRRFTSPTQQFSRRSPAEEQGKAPRHAAYQEHRPYQDHSSYSGARKNGRDCPETHPSFTEHDSSEANFQRLPPYGVYPTFPANFPQFPLTGGFRVDGSSSNTHILEQKANQQSSRGVYDSRYDQSSRDPRQNTSQYVAHFLPQQPLVDRSYVQNDGQYIVRRFEQGDEGPKSYHTATGTTEPFIGSRQLHNKDDERYLRQRSRP